MVVAPLVVRIKTGDADLDDYFAHVWLADRGAKKHALVRTKRTTLTCLMIDLRRD
jgi:hypothetical protein